MYKGGMLFEDYERRAARTHDDNPEFGTPEWQRAVMICVMGICGEAGEIADKVKKVFGHGHDIPGDDIIEEGGDLVWYLARLAKLFGVTLEEMARRNNVKLEIRYPDGFSSAASKARVDVAKPPSQLASFGCTYCERRDCQGTCETAQNHLVRLEKQGRMLASPDKQAPEHFSGANPYEMIEGVSRYHRERLFNMGRSETAEAGGPLLTDPAVNAPEPYKEFGPIRLMEKVPASLRNRRCTNPECSVCRGGILGQVCPNAPKTEPCRLDDPETINAEINTARAGLGLPPIDPTLGWPKAEKATCQNCQDHPSGCDFCGRSGRSPRRA